MSVVIIRAINGDTTIPQVAERMHERWEPIKETAPIRA